MENKYFNSNVGRGEVSQLVRYSQNLSIRDSGSEDFLGGLLGDGQKFSNI